MHFPALIFDKFKYSCIFQPTSRLLIKREMKKDIRNTLLKTANKSIHFLLILMALSLYPVSLSAQEDRRDQLALHLYEHKGDARPDTLVYFYVMDVDKVSAEFNSPVINQPWAREVRLTDPDGNRLRIGQLK